MHAEKNKVHAANVSRNPGREAVRRNGERHYINQRPAFALHYYPAKQPEQPEELWYHVFEHELLVYGYKLLPLYDGDFCISPRKGIFHSSAESFPQSGLVNTH
jgi:hypothetical protein